MKISKIAIYAHKLNVVNGPYVYSGGTLGALTSCLVEITADNGVSGWGETCPLGPTYQPAHASGALAALQEVAPHLIGIDALPGPVSQAMDAALDGHNYAKAAVDIAIYDLLGKATSLPVHALLGGALRPKIPSYYAISLQSPEETARQVLEKQAQGYQAIQIKIGSRDVQKDATVLRAAWAVLAPGVTLAADANRSMGVGAVVHLSKMVADIPLVLEQPCRTLEETANLFGRVSHPIYLDEATIDVGTVTSVVGQGKCDGLGMKLTRVGGLSAMRTIRDIAAARSIPISVDDSWGGDVIAAACVHMGATVSPKLFRGTWLAAPYIDHHYDTALGIEIKDGWIDVPLGPGLGVVPENGMFGAPVFET